MAENPYTMKL